VGAPEPTSFITYEDYVDLSRKLMRGGPAAVKQSVLSVLRGIAFPGFRAIFRTLFPGDARFSAEINAAVTPLFFTWLVGPAMVEPAEVVNPQT
jgi:hypothetical protein